MSAAATPLFENTVFVNASQNIMFAIACKTTHLAKLIFKTITRSNTSDPVVARREKLIAGLKEQQLVHAAVLKGEAYRVERQKWMHNEHGERVSVKTHRRIRPWFFEQDGGRYEQCHYGALVIAADRINNAVFVKSLTDTTLFEQVIRFHLLIQATQLA